MAEREIRTVTTLTKKRRQIEQTIAAYEYRLTQARADLAAVKAAIVVFERIPEAAVAYPYSDVSHLFRYGERGSLCLAALATGQKTTTQLARHVAEAKGFDTGDRVLLRGLTHSVLCSMRGMEARRTVRRLGKGRVVTWTLQKSP